MALHSTKQQARNFLLKKQLLFQPQSLQGPNGIEQVFQTLRLIQYDPLNPCGRNVDLVLQTRVADYHPDAYYTWLYQEKKSIECYDKELCIIPIEDFALAKHHINRAQKTKQQFLSSHQTALGQLIERIAKEGPLASADIQVTTRVASGWGDEAKFGRIALETLWKTGKLVVVNREKGKKYYDLPYKRHAATASDNDAIHALTTTHIIRRVKSVGLLPKSPASNGWQGLGLGKAVLINQLIESKKLVEVFVEGCRRPYVALREDEAVLNSPPTQETMDKKVIFLAPLDNLMWDRAMINELFGFFYRWEVYTPLHKRKFGYYVLPILYGDTFIGRIESVLTKDKKLIIKGFWQEDAAVWDEQTYDAFKIGLDKFKNYLHATEIVSAPV